MLPGKCFSFHSVFVTHHVHRYNTPYAVTVNGRKNNPCNLPRLSHSIFLLLAMDEHLPHHSALGFVL